MLDAFGTYLGWLKYAPHVVAALFLLFCLAMVLLARAVARRNRVALQIGRSVV